MQHFSSFSFTVRCELLTHIPPPGELKVIRLKIIHKNSFNILNKKSFLRFYIQWVLLKNFNAIRQLKEEESILVRYKSNILMNTHLLEEYNILKTFQPNPRLLAAADLNLYNGVQGGIWNRNVLNLIFTRENTGTNQKISNYNKSNNDTVPLELEGAKLPLGEVAV